MRQEPNGCAIDGCERRVVARGWCTAHYQRWRKHSDPLGGGTTPGEPIRYFNEVVLPYEGDDCLIWPYSRTSSGYGNLTVDGLTRSAHSLVCETVHGPAPTPAHEAAHSCGKGTSGCVTKGHLSWKTPSENQADKLIHGTCCRGERNGLAKLTSSDVDCIRTLVGIIPRREIAKTFNVSYQTVTDIHTGRSWSWLNDHRSERTA